MHIKIDNVIIDGFAVSSAQPGEKVLVQVKGIETSEMASFYVFAEQIANVIFPKTGILNLIDSINQFLVVIHPDHSADFYGQNFETLAKVRATRNINAGQVVYSNDIDDISDVTFPNIEINPDDQVIYLKRTRWRFGLYFDLSRKLDNAELGNDLAELHKQLIFEDILKKVLTELKLKEEQALNDKKFLYDAFIITEGKTDVSHLKRAFSKNGYSRHIEYSETVNDLGDTGLFEICRRAFHLPPNKIPVICVFDRDNPQIIKKLLAEKFISKNKGIYQCWGNNVYSLILPIPDDRKKYQNISIEMYYTDDVISRITHSGKRLYFDNEIKREILPGNKIRLIQIPPDKTVEFSKKIYDTNVDEIKNENGDKLGISKSVFSEMIFKEEEPFDKDIDFRNFSLISDILDTIIRNPEQ